MIEARAMTEILEAHAKTDLNPQQAPRDNVTPFRGAASPHREDDDCLFIKGYVVPHDLLPAQSDPWSGVSLLDTITRS